MRKIAYPVLFALAILITRYYVDSGVFLYESSYQGPYRPLPATNTIDKWVDNPKDTKDYFYLGKAGNYEFWQWEDDGEICHAVKHVDDSFEQIEVGCPATAKVRSDGLIFNYERDDEHIWAWFPGFYPDGSKASNPLILRSSRENPDPIECMDENPEVCAGLYEYGLSDIIVDYFKEYILLYYANYGFILSDGSEYVIRNERGEILKLDI